MFSDALFSRSAPLLGSAAAERLKSSRVLVFGLGGVGGSAVEALARAGVGNLTLVDGDIISPSDLNRQIIALTSTVGRLKTDVSAERALDINPKINIDRRPIFFSDETAKLFDFSEYDYILDAVDSVSAKLLIAETAYFSHVPAISAMGAGNKTDPTAFEVDDIYNTSICPLARVMRRELKKRGVESLRVVWSKEPPKEPSAELRKNGRPVPSSVSFVPPVAGFILAGEAIKYLAGLEDAR